MSKRAKKPARDFVGEWAEGIRNMRFEQGCGRSGDPREADEYEGYVAPAPPDREAREKMAREAAETHLRMRELPVTAGEVISLSAAFLAFAESVEKMR